MSLFRKFTNRESSHEQDLESRLQEPLSHERLAGLADGATKMVSHLLEMFGSQMEPDMRDALTATNEQAREVLATREKMLAAQARKR